MQTTEYIWLNGELIPWADAKIHVLSHGLHYGSGAFEGIRFYNTDKGPAIFRLDEHLKRLVFSASAIGMTLPFSQQQIKDATIDLVRSNKLDTGYIRPLAFYGYGKMGVGPVGAPVEIMIACWPWGAYLPYDMVDIKTSKFIRIPPRATIGEAKLTGSYLNGIFSILDIQGTKYHEALLLDHEGFIAEGPGENFFMVKNNIITTPKLGSILPGITRATIMMLAEKLGYKVIEANITLEEAYKADETFFTGTAAEVTPIHSIDDNVIADGKIGPVTAKIRETYLDIVNGRNKEFVNFLTYVD